MLDPNDLTKDLRKEILLVPNDSKKDGLKELTKDGFARKDLLKDGMLNLPMMLLGLKTDLMYYLLS